MWAVIVKGIGASDIRVGERACLDELLVYVRGDPSIVGVRLMLGGGHSAWYWNCSDLEATVARNRKEQLDAGVMARLRAPFGCEFINTNEGKGAPYHGYWRVHDANDDAIASVSAREEGYARLIVQALNEHFERKGSGGSCDGTCSGNELGDCSHAGGAR